MSDGAEVVAAFMRVFTIPLAREIVTVMQERGLVVARTDGNTVPMGELTRERAARIGLEQRLAQAEALNRGLHEQIIKTQDALAYYETRKRPDTRPTAQEAERAAVMDELIDHEDATPQPAAQTHKDATPADTGHESPATVPDSGDLIDLAEVCRLTGLAGRSVGYQRKHGQFPAPVSKRGPANLWRREDVTAWQALRTEGPDAGGEDLLDLPAIGRMVGYTTASLYVRISEGKFPKHTNARGKKHLWRRSVVEQWLAQRASGRGKNGATPQADTCGNCADRKTLGKQSICGCGSKENTNRLQSVKLSHTCDWHRKPNPQAYRPARMDEEA